MINISCWYYFVEQSILFPFLFLGCQLPPMAPLVLSVGIFRHSFWASLKTDRHSCHTQTCATALESKNLLPGHTHHLERGIYYSNKILGSGKSCFRYARKVKGKRERETLGNPESMKSLFFRLVICPVTFQR